MLDCRDVAKYFLSQADEEAGDSMTNLQLQKLLYYAQGFHLAIHNGPLFDEPIYAWAHGPVVRPVYQEYREYGAGTIPIPDDVDFSVFTSEQSKLLDDVYQSYGQFSGWRLREMTHDEPPWKDTPSNQQITRDQLQEYFKTQLSDEQEPN